MKNFSPMFTGWFVNSQGTWQIIPLGFLCVSETHDTQGVPHVRPAHTSSGWLGIALKRRAPPYLSCIAHVSTRLPILPLHTEGTRFNYFYLNQSQGSLLNRGSTRTQRRAKDGPEQVPEKQGKGWGNPFSHRIVQDWLSDCSGKHVKCLRHLPFPRLRPPLSFTSPLIHCLERHVFRCNGLFTYLSFC
jgi:hypothetical protein